MFNNEKTLLNMSLIVAIDNQGGIAKEGVIPWSIQNDLLFFLDVTKRNYNNKRNILIMGKNTYLSLNGKTLKDRIIIVISSTLWENQEDVYFCTTLKEAVDKAIQLDQGQLFFCGGKHIYEQCMPYVNTIYLTQIDDDYQCDVTIDIHANHFCTYSKDTFMLTDTKNNKNVNVTFIKMYLNECPFIKTEEHQYLDLLKKILLKGHLRQTRNAMVYSLFGDQMIFDLSDWTLPLFTTKKVMARFVFEELLFFLRGQTNSKILQDKGIHIWDSNSSREFLDTNGFHHYETNDIGNLYGFQFLHYGCDYKGYNQHYEGYNQLEETIKLLKKDLYSRRILMTSFDPSRANQGVLYPCHSNILQWYVEGDDKLSVHMYQRSADFMCGIPYNVCSLALFCMLMCQTLNSDPTFSPKLEPGRIIMSFGDMHIYNKPDHLLACIRQMNRTPYPFPQIKIKQFKQNIADYEWEDLELINYQCDPHIPIKMVA